MNAKKYIGILLLVVLIGVLIIKIPRREADVPVVENPTPSVSTSVAGATLSINGDFKYLNETEFLSVEALYPSQTPLLSEANTQARFVIESWVNERITAFTSLVNNELLNADEEARLRASGQKYATGISYKQYASDAYVSYVFQVYEDTGGAHPNTAYKTFTFDTNGDVVELANLFTPGSKYLDRLSKLAYDGVRAELKKRGAGTLDENQLDWVREGTAPDAEMFQSFYLDGSNLVLVFPPYQVAAYAAGMIEVRIPLSTVADIR